MNNDEIQSYADNMTATPRYVGVSATTITARHGIEICKIFKERFPETTVIMGGAHASLIPEDGLRSPYIDLVVRREGEGALLELIKLGLPMEEIKGLSFKRNGDFVHNPDRPLLRELDSLPMPAYHLINVRECRPSYGNYVNLPAVPVLTSKGCTHKCTFCGTHLFGRMIRFKSPEKVINELAHLVDSYGVREICFYDDVFSASKSRTMRICEMMIERKFNLTWSCLCRVDQVPRDLLIKMKAAGCHTISFGVESADAGILTTMNKRADLEKVEAAVRDCKEVGLDQRLAFMFGTPGETKESMQNTFEFAKRLAPKHALFNITTPYPGSEMYQWAVKNDAFITDDWTRFDGTESLLKLEHLTKKDVEDFCFMARNHFINRFRERQEVDA